jgi:hypothetical protein
MSQPLRLTQLQSIDEEETELQQPQERKKKRRERDLTTEAEESRLVGAYERALSAAARGDAASGCQILTQLLKEPLILATTAAPGGGSHRAGGLHVCQPL